jgi:hypothetical protein
VCVCEREREREREREICVRGRGGGRPRERESARARERERERKREREIFHVKVPFYACARVETPCMCTGGGKTPYMCRGVGGDTQDIYDKTMCGARIQYICKSYNYKIEIPHDIRDISIDGAIYLSTHLPNTYLHRFTHPSFHPST